MALEVFWTEEAILSYNKIIDYLGEKWSEKEVANFINTLNNTLAQLVIGNVSFRKSNKKNYHEVLISKHNLLIYRIVNDRVELILFWDTRQNPKTKKTG